MLSDGKYGQLRLMSKGGCNKSQHENGKRAPRFAPRITRGLRPLELAASLLLFVARNTNWSCQRRRLMSIISYLEPRDMISSISCNL